MENEIAGIDSGRELICNTPNISLLWCKKIGNGGTCTYGGQCRFVHSEEDLEHRKEILRESKRQKLRWKNGICKSYSEGLICPFGEKCRFAHVVGDQLLECLKANEMESKKKQEKNERKQAAREKQKQILSSNDEGLIDYHSCDMSDDVAFREWITKRIKECKLYDSYFNEFDSAVLAILRWRQRFQHRPDIWSRFMKGNATRLLKELSEAIPMIALVLQLVESSELPDGKQFTILDLCSGFGFLSMFLSEMLPSEKINRILLIDKQWSRHAYMDSVSANSSDGGNINNPVDNNKSIGSNDNNIDVNNGDCNVCEDINSDMIEDEDSDDNAIEMDVENVVSDKQSNQYINPDHLVGEFYNTWPIPLTPCKQNLKSRATLRSMQRVLIDRSCASGPLIIFGIHLCGILSLRAVDIFNDNIDNVHMFALKPCCLPNMTHVKKKETFVIGSHKFDAKEVCASGKWVAKSKGTWTGPPRNHLEQRFHNWSNNLMLGINTNICLPCNVNDEQVKSFGTTGGMDVPDSVNSSMWVKYITKVQLQDIGYQNSYIIAHRRYATIQSLNK